MHFLKSVFHFQLRLLAFWLLFFALFRLWFVLWFRDEWSIAHPNSVWSAFGHALPLDLSMAGYLMVVPILLWFVGLALGSRAYPFFTRIISGFNCILIGVLILIFGSNIFLYEEWHTLLNTRALAYLRTPRALLDSLSLGFIVASVVLFVTAMWIIWKAYARWVSKHMYHTPLSRWGLLAFPIQLALLALVIRGGLGVMPINESAVYFSDHIFDNHAATNTAWSLAHSQLEQKAARNSYHWMDDTEAQKRVNTLLKNDTTQATPALLNTPAETPINIVIVMMESMTAQVIEDLGGEAGICPNLEQLAHEGILFSNCYGSGYRTDQGLVSVLGGYPAQPDQSIVLQSDKAARLGSLSAFLQSKDYATLFCYGGELTFANIGVWLRNQHFERIISEKDFDRAEKTQRWGVDDKRMLQRFSLEINQLREPFLATGLTLSLHPPFDVPHHSRWENGPNGASDQFRHSAAFADEAIGDFMRQVSQQPWAERTIFVFVADHGATQPKPVSSEEPPSRHIPLVIWGKPLRTEWRGQQLRVFANHHDIPATILALLGHQKPDNMPWSRNLWTTRSDFAYYTNENGIGWMTAQGRAFFHFGGSRWQFFDAPLDSTQRTAAQAYLQVLYEDFLRK
jgi:phosphoglycerol transferase MdoB-like AlkP superfamily enzyme